MLYGAVFVIFVMFHYRVKKYIKKNLEQTKNFNLSTRK